MGRIAEDPWLRGSAVEKHAEAIAHAHHGELLQGAFEDDRGRLHRGLVTLPLDGLISTATVVLKKGRKLTVSPRSRTKALRAVKLTLEFLGHAQLGGRVSITSEIPIGHGYGSSTADVVASIRAVAAALEQKLLPSTISRIAVAAETASDAIAFESQALLFAQREGVVLEHFGDSLPPFVLIGFRSAASSDIDTLELAPARYNDEELQLFRVLRGMVARAVRYQDVRLLGRAATLSAHVSQRHLPKPGFDFVARLADERNACGVQVAHSGSLFGLMFDPRSATLDADTGSIIAGLKARDFPDIRVFFIHGASSNHEH